MSKKEKALSDYIQPSLIFLGENFEEATHLFEFVHQQAFEKDLVEASFLEKLKEREAVFPTGIQLEEMGGAIPHTDPACIKKEFVAIVTVPEGVLFSRMDLPTSEVRAKIVFVLGLKEPHAQLKMLQSLSQIFRQTEKIGYLQKEKEVQLFIEQVKEMEKNEED